MHSPVSLYRMANAAGDNKLRRGAGDPLPSGHLPGHRGIAGWDVTFRTDQGVVSPLLDYDGSGYTFRIFQERVTKVLPLLS